MYGLYKRDAKPGLVRGPARRCRAGGGGLAGVWNGCRERRRERNKDDGGNLIVSFFRRPSSETDFRWPGGNQFHASRNEKRCPSRGRGGAGRGSRWRRRGRVGRPAPPSPSMKMGLGLCGPGLQPPPHSPPREGEMVAEVEKAAPRGGRVYALRVDSKEACAKVHEGAGHISLFP